MKVETHIVRVFVASPADTAEERRIISEVITDINRLHGRPEHFRLDLLVWEEDSYPDVGADAQDVINRQIGDYDIFLGLLSTKLGSPTSRANSGTEEEFGRAFEKHLENPASVKILFYFRNPTVKLLDLDLYQALQVQRFRDRISKLGVRYSVYDGVEDFRRRVTGDLLRHTRDVIRQESGSSPLDSVPDAPDEILTVSLDDWNATTMKTSPQWANYREIPLEKYSYSSFSIKGRFQSNSPYFRFGFKLLTVRGRLFGDGSIQSQDNNLVVHIGKNKGKNQLFVATYYNGLGQVPDREILDYSDSRQIPVEISVGRDSMFRLIVDDREVYQTYISPAIKERLVIIAWGDRDEYEVHFREISLQLKQEGKKGISPIIDTVA